MTRTIPPDVSARQIEASDPDVSAWVSANAGSGKTHVLAQRVIRQLLAGCDPSKILCLTFTKAAAANMAARVFKILGEWAASDDAKLDMAIAAFGSKPSDATRRRARQLFARALETPGGLKVQTIHAFCTGLLHQFPFESRTAARFTVLDEAQERQLLDQTLLAVLLRASAEPETALGRALAHAIASQSDFTFRNVIEEAIGKRDAVEALIGQGNIDDAGAKIAHALGVQPDETRDSLDAAFFAQSLIQESDWPAVVATLVAGNKSDAKHEQRFAIASRLSGEPRLDAYLSIFCTAEMKPRASVVTDKIKKNAPELYDLLNREQARVCALLAKRRAIEARDRTVALMHIAHAVITRYRAEKARRGLLDYDDLIDKSLALFTTVPASWVHYKTDLGIDHLLIDEAQDTSSKQWQIIEKLVSEFAAGAGARDRKRTLFAVGDEKQSIFSFQGAAPEQFDAMRKFFQRGFQEAGLELRAVKFETSFRSGEIVLGAVDTVFKREQAFSGLTADSTATVHSWLPEAAPGLVEIWEIEKAEKKDAIEGWRRPFDAVSETSPRVTLARRIVARIEALRAQGRKPGDMLVLVRQRGELFEAVIRALKAAAVPVAGADRLVLTEHIAVMDLLALADAILLPDDDLALATILKSPLFGLNEEQLFELAHDRGGKPLHRVLRARANGDGDIARAAALFARYEDAARTQTPFGFYAWLLGAQGGRRQFLARLGHEAADALDEFLNLALDYESREAATLQGFAGWLRAARADIKRDMEMDRDEVRVMTVHGAKGLEAPVVFLADTTTEPAGPPQMQDRLLPLPDTSGVPGRPDRLVWMGRKETDTETIATARDISRNAACDEYRRLLYVAMTRAAHTLIVCGAEGVNARPKGCWYDLISDAIKPHAVELPAPDGNGSIWRMEKPGGDEQKPETEKPSPPDLNLLPPWLSTPLPRSPQPATITASSDEAWHPGGTVNDNPLTRAQARARGVIVHRLLQSLPDIADEKRDAAAKTFLSRRADFDDAQKSAIAAQVLAVLRDARFGILFGAGSRAEVPVVGRLSIGGESIAVNGQIDRLAATNDAVWIADFKTGQPVPFANVPHYVRQLSLYRALLQKIYPQKDVHAGLLWLEGPSFEEIPPHALDASLASLTPA